MMLLAFILCAFVAVRADKVEQRIVNGMPATYGDHSYICSLQRLTASGWFHICGSVIYNTRYVATAAHCLDTRFTYRVQCGLHIMNSVDEKQVAHDVQSFTKHPQYNGNIGGYPNDIALMKLATPLRFNDFVNKGEFATSGSFAGEECKLSGWGLTQGGGSTANTLKKVNIMKITNRECQRKWSGIWGASINDGHICFFDNHGSACNGDSGGPVRCGNIITGLTSWGISTCGGNYPSVYTRVSRFSDWLRQVAGGQDV